jgi:hypothetical protein
MNCTLIITTILNILITPRLNVRKQGEKTLRHDWIIFDTVDEAMNYFNDQCGVFVGYYA